MTEAFREVEVIGIIAPYIGISADMPQADRELLSQKYREKSLLDSFIFRSSLIKALPKSIELCYVDSYWRRSDGSPNSPDAAVQISVTVYKNPSGGYIASIFFCLYRQVNLDGMDGANTVEAPLYYRNKTIVAKDYDELYNETFKAQNELIKYFVDDFKIYGNIKQ